MNQDIVIMFFNGIWILFWVIVMPMSYVKHRIKMRALRAIRKGHVLQIKYELLKELAGECNDHSRA